MRAPARMAAHRVLGCLQPSVSRHWYRLGAGAAVAATKAGGLTMHAVFILGNRSWGEGAWMGTRDLVILTLAALVCAGGRALLAQC